jgi:hypothetical protein
MKRPNAPLRVQLNALRLLARDIVEFYDCTDWDVAEGEEPHGGDWEECFKCTAERALTRPQDFNSEASMDSLRGKAEP